MDPHTRTRRLLPTGFRKILDFRSVRFTEKFFCVKMLENYHNVKKTQFFDALNFLFFFKRFSNVFFFKNEISYPENQFRFRRTKRIKYRKLAASEMCSQQTKKYIYSFYFLYRMSYHSSKFVH